MVKIITVLICLLLGGCSYFSAPTVQRCPAIAPVLACPEWPVEEQPKSLLELQRGYIEGEIVYVQCSSTVRVWQETWDKCGE